MTLRIQVPIIDPAWLADVRASMAILQPAVDTIAEVDVRDIQGAAADASRVWAEVQPMVDDIARVAAHLPAIEFVPVSTINVRRDAPHGLRQARMRTGHRLIGF